MNNQDFKRLYNLSDASPQSPTLSIMGADGLSEAISEFINKKFRGVAHVYCEHIGDREIFCSAEYTAYIFKTLLADIYGRVFLNIMIKELDDNLEIMIEADDVLPLNEKEMRNLIRISRNAGMKIYPGERTIRLSMSFFEAAASRVYAKSVHDSKSLMLGKLQEIVLLPEVILCKGRKSD